MIDRKPLAAAALVVLAFAAPARAEKVQKAAWIEAVRNALPAAFCAPEGYFRSCFRITAAECEERAASATRICLRDKDEAIPATLELPADGQKWGASVGQCAGQSFELALTKKKIQSKKCNDPSAWM